MGQPPQQNGQNSRNGQNGQQQNGMTRGGGQNGMREGGMGGGGGMGGLLNGQTVNAKVEAALKKNASDYTWAAAAIGSQNAASYQLASGKPVMAIGGFNGSDPSPTLAQFKQYVADGKIHYFLSSDDGDGRDRGNTSISTWVKATFKKVTVDGTTLYDLTQKAS